MNRYRVHRVNFYKPEPKAVQCLAYDEGSHKLAVVRSDSSIELWYLRYAPYLEGVIPGRPGDSIESIVWCRNRLFSTGLQAHVTEYDLQKLSPMYSVPVTSGPAWCLGLNQEKTRLAVGTEDGYVCIFEITPDGLNFDKTLNKQEGRILCLSWHKDGKTLVTSSVDAIRIWDVDSGQTVDKISVGRLEKRAENVVWCIKVLSDMTIVSGDSCGQTSFWDGRTGTLLSSIRSHKADVLSLCVSKDEKTVYSSGVDPVIVQFTHVSQGVSSQDSWIRSFQKSVHTHDVKALVLFGKTVISGGADAFLKFTGFNIGEGTTEYFPFQQTSMVQVAKEAGHILLNYKTHLELWKLGTTRTNEGEDGAVLPLSTGPENILRMNCKDGFEYICSTISPNGNWIACASLDHLAVYQLSTIPAPSIKKAKIIDSLPGFCHLMRFTSDSSRLLLYTSSHAIYIFEMGPTVKLLHTFTDFSEKWRVHLLAISTNGEYLAAANVRGSVMVYSLKTFQVECQLPKCTHTPTSMEFEPNTDKLIVVYCSQKVIEYSVSEKEYSPWSRHISSKGELKLDPQRSIIGLNFDPRNSSRIMFYNPYSFHVVNREENSESKLKNAVAICKKYEYLLKLETLQEDYLLVIELPSDSLLENLPPPLKKKRFGM